MNKRFSSLNIVDMAAWLMAAAAFAFIAAAGVAVVLSRKLELTHASGSKPDLTPGT